MACARFHGSAVRQKPVADDGSLASTYFRNGFVSQETACYACHTRPGLTGYAEAKLAGIRDVYVHFLGEVPEEITLRSDYSNTICLKCHADAGSFEGSQGHRYPETLIDDVLSGKVSCLMCHGAGHTLEDDRSQLYFDFNDGSSLSSTHP